MCKMMCGLSKLLKIIDELFAFNINPKTNRKEIEINPNLK